MKLMRWRLVLVLAATVGAGTAWGSAQVPQTWLPGECIPEFATGLPVFGPGYNAALPRVNALTYPALKVKMVEASRQVLPTGDYSGTDLLGRACPGVTVQPTNVFAYEVSNLLTGKILGPAFWPAVTVESRRFIPTLIQYENHLPSVGQGGVMQGLITVDQTIHWADPLHVGGMNPCMDDPSGAAGCDQPYTGPIPAVPHLHGAEVPSQFDGGPDAWFTPTGLQGTGYNSLWNAGPGKAVYLYPNFQLPGTLWFHDHALGATRTNVYSGLEAFYVLRDPAREPKNLPSDAYEIEMAVQDRQFDTNSQLFWPDGSGPQDCVDGDGNPVQCSNLNGPPPNPDLHPFWIPEFAGDTVVVNGSPWPYLNVEPRRYRFRVLDGSNARFYNLTFGGAPVHVIGADDTYLDAPVPVSTVFLAPGERADIIVDFTGMAGQNVTVTNDAPIPYPDGLFPVPHPDGMGGTAPADQPQMAKIMQFRVNVALKGRDRSCNPATGGCKLPGNVVRLTDGNGHLAPGVKIDRVRQLVLKEFEGGGGPVEVLVNNTKWDGRRSPSINDQFPVDGISEVPRVGSTEIWEIINLTVDAHPMHTHLVQFQILDRQAFDTDETTGYPAVWAGAFGTNPNVPLPSACTTGEFCPGYGPPLPYLTPNADGAIGGNPAIGPYLQGTAAPPDPWESGWKDMAKAYPGQVTRLVIRWTPTSTSKLFAKTGRNLFPFDPTSGPGYVWHCHIIDHEDNEMMRPYRVGN